MELTSCYCRNKKNKLTFLLQSTGWLMEQMWCLKICNQVVIHRLQKYNCTTMDMLVKEKDNGQKKTVFLFLASQAAWRFCAQPLHQKVTQHFSPEALRDNNNKAISARFQSFKHSPTTLTLVFPLSLPPELLAIQVYTSSSCQVTLSNSKITVLSPFTNTFPFLIHATSGAGTPFDQQCSLTSAPNTTDCSEVINIILAGTGHIE